MSDNAVTCPHCQVAVTARGGRCPRCRKPIVATRRSRVNQLHWRAQTSVKASLSALFSVPMTYCFAVYSLWVVLIMLAITSMFAVVGILQAVRVNRALAQAGQPPSGWAVAGLITGILGLLAVGVSCVLIVFVLTVKR